MTDLSSSQLLQFIGKRYSGADDVVKAMDAEIGNGDGTLKYNEFKPGMQGLLEKDGGFDSFSQSEIDSAIQTAWFKFDTNRVGKGINTLDEKEAAEANKTLEWYVQLDDFIQANVASAPSEVGKYASAWKSDVSEALSDKVAAAIKSGESMDSFFAELSKELPAIETKCTATYCAAVAQDSVASLLKQYSDYKIGDDSTLKSLINAQTEEFLAEIKNGDTVNPSTILTTMQSLIANYLATAGLGNGDAKQITRDDYKNWNDLQKAVFTQQVKDGLDSTITDNVYSDLLSSALEDFINEQISSQKYGEYTVNDCVAGFKETNAYKIITTYGSIDGDETFKNALKAQYGEAAVTVLAGLMDTQDYQDMYTAILKDVIAAGTSKDKAQNAIQEAITKQIVAFLEGNLKSMNLKNLSTLYTNMTSDAVAGQKGTSKLQSYQDAAYLYCNALCSKGGKMKEAVVSILGDDYKTAIYNFTDTTELNDAIAQIKEIVNIYGDVNEFKASISDKLIDGVKESIKVPFGTTGNIAKFPDTTTYTDSENKTITIDSDRITYNSSNSAIKIDNDGNVTLNTSSTSGTFSTVVTVYVDGVICATKNINVTVSSVDSIKWTAPAVDKVYAGGDAGFRVWGGDNEYNDQNLSVAGLTFNDLYNGNYNIELGTDRREDGKYHNDRMLPRLDKLGESVVNALASIGLSEVYLKEAMEDVNKRWKDNINNQGDLTSKGCNKAEQRESTDGSYMKLSGKVNGNSGIYCGKDTAGTTNQKIYMINFKAYVDAIIEKYNEIAGTSISLS